MIAKRIQFYVEMPRRITFLLAFVLLALVLPAAAQQATPSTGPPPPPAQQATPSSGPPPPPAQQATPSSGPPPPPPPPEEPVFDPYHAQKSIEIGKFYMDKGDYDAAIGRFEDAARYQPKLALPWELLGEVWEKKHDKEKALDAYKKFLELLPQGGDSDRVRKRVAKLQEDLARESRRAQ